MDWNRRQLTLFDFGLSIFALPGLAFRHRWTENNRVSGKQA